jgi:hypothetical protein
MKEEGIVYLLEGDVFKPLRWLVNDCCEHAETICTECISTWWEENVIFVKIGPGMMLMIDHLMMADRPMPTLEERAL